MLLWRHGLPPFPLQPVGALLLRKKPGDPARAAPGAGAATLQRIVGYVEEPGSSGDEAGACGRRANNPFDLASSEEEADAAGEAVVDRWVGSGAEGGLHVPDGGPRRGLVVLSREAGSQLQETSRLGNFGQLPMGTCACFPAQQAVPEAPSTQADKPQGPLQGRRRWRHHQPDCARTLEQDSTAGLLLNLPCAPGLGGVCYHFRIACSCQLAMPSKL